MRMLPCDAGAPCETASLPLTPPEPASVVVIADWVAGLALHRGYWLFTDASRDLEETSADSRSAPQAAETWEG